MNFPYEGGGFCFCPEADGTDDLLDVMVVSNLAKWKVSYLLPMALFVGRRPSPQSYLIDTRDGRLLQTLHSPAQRHFYGHAVFHKDGEWLYATENDTSDPGRGVLGVYRLQGEQLLRSSELSTHGLGPHQLLWLPDGETLAVANGGIRTEAESRVEMNLDAMESSLVLMRRDGSLISKEQLPEHHGADWIKLWEGRRPTDDVERFRLYQRVR